MNEAGWVGSSRERWRERTRETHSPSKWALVTQFQPVFLCGNGDSVRPHFLTFQDRVSWFLKSSNKLKILCGSDKICTWF